MQTELQATTKKVHEWNLVDNYYVKPTIQIFEVEPDLIEVSNFSLDFTIFSV